MTRPCFQRVATETLDNQKRGQCSPSTSFLSFILVASETDNLPLSRHVHPSLPIHHWHLHGNHLVLLC